MVTEVVMLLLLIFLVITLTVVVVYVLSDLEDDRMTLANVGTTAEVLAVKEDVDNLSGLSATRIKAIGRQRFKVLSTSRQLGGYVGFCFGLCITNAKVLNQPDTDLHSSAW